MYAARSLPSFLLVILLTTSPFAYSGVAPSITITNEARYGVQFSDFYDVFTATTQRIEALTTRIGTNPPSYRVSPLRLDTPITVRLNTNEYAPDEEVGYFTNGLFTMYCTNFTLTGEIEDALEFGSYDSPLTWTDVWWRVEYDWATNTYSTIVKLITNFVETGSAYGDTYEGYFAGGECSPPMWEITNYFNYKGVDGGGLWGELAGFEVSGDPFPVHNTYTNWIQAAKMVYGLYRTAPDTLWLVDPLSDTATCGMPSYGGEYIPTVPTNGFPVDTNDIPVGVELTDVVIAEFAVSEWVAYNGNLGDIHLNDAFYTSITEDVSFGAFYEVGGVQRPYPVAEGISDGIESTLLAYFAPTDPNEDGTLCSNECPTTVYIPAYEFEQGSVLITSSNGTSYIGVNSKPAEVFGTNVLCNLAIETDPGDELADTEMGLISGEPHFGCYASVERSILVNMGFSTNGGYSVVFDDPMPTYRGYRVEANVVNPNLPVMIVDWDFDIKYEHFAEVLIEP